MGKIKSFSATGMRVARTMFRRAMGETQQRFLRNRNGLEAAAAAVQQAQ